MISLRKVIESSRKAMAYKKMEPTETEKAKVVVG